MCLATSVVAQPNELVDVRLPQQVTPHMVRAIAEIGEPNKRITRENDTLNSLVAEKCGSIDPIYFSILSAMNPELVDGGQAPSVTRPLPAGKTITLPACAPPPAPLVRQIETGDALSKIIPPAVTPVTKIDATVAAGARADILNSALGQRLNIDMERLPTAVFGQSQAAARATNSTTLSTIRVDQVGPGFVCASYSGGSNYCLPRLDGAQRAPASAPTTPLPPRTTSPLGGIDAIARLQLGSAIDPTRLSAGEFIVAPAQQPVARSIVLKAGISAGDAVGRIRSAAKLDRVSDPQIQLAAVVGIKADIPVPAAGANAACEASVDRNLWPLPVAALIAQRQRNEKLRQQSGPDDPTSAKILVLDSGFDFRGRVPGFPDDFFARAKGLNTGTTSGILTNRYYHDRGLNFAELGNSAASAENYVVGDRELRWHGVAVVSAALGTRSFNASRTPGLARIVPASAVASVGDGAVMSGQSLLRAIDYAFDEQITILNFSATMETDPGLKLSLSSTKGKLLLVVPAGNEPVDAAQFWPAGHGGGSAVGSVITVGGQEPDGTLWAQSGRSRQVVDLLAPACGIPVYEGQAGAPGTPLQLVETDFAGTSFAAPLVSFVAGILAYEKLGPSDIKQRLQASARLTPSAWTTTYSGGVLDAVTAISVYEDVLRYRDAGGVEQRVMGKLSSPDDVYRICDEDDIAADRVLKFAVVEIDGKRKVRSIVRPITGEVVARTDCPLEDNQFELKFTPGDGSQHLALSHQDVIDFVRRQ